MALKKYKLGELIEENTNKNEKLKYGASFVRGVTNSKQIAPTKATIDEGVLHKFYIVEPMEFIYNPRTTRNGEKISIALNDSDETLLFTFNDVSFRIKETAKDIILPHYLYLFTCRGEFDRYVRTNSWGSATELFSFAEMCDIDIELPPIEIQQKYVNVYKAMVANQKAYEKGLDDLKLVCDAYVEDLRRKHPCEEIGKYIECTDRKNTNSNLEIRGISNKQKLIPSESRTIGVNKEKYLQIDAREFGYSPIHINDGSIAFNDSANSFLLSPIYKTFKVKDENKLYPEYLMLWFARNEFIRYCKFHAFGSARDTFDWKEMCEVSIPIPDISIQKAIANIYKVYCTRKEINEKLKAQIKDLCPILIAGAVQEAKKEK